MRANKRLKNESTCKEEMRQEKSLGRAKSRLKNEKEFRDQRSDEKRQRKANLNGTEEGRRKLFRDSIRDGRIFPCICCHRLCFRNSVQLFSNEFETEINNKYENIIKCSIGTERVEKVQN